MILGESIMKQVSGRRQVSFPCACDLYQVRKKERKKERRSQKFRSAEQSRAGVSDAKDIKSNLDDELFNGFKKVFFASVTYLVLSLVAAADRRRSKKRV